MFAQALIHHFVTFWKRWTIDWRDEMNTKQNPSYCGGGMILAHVSKEKVSESDRQMSRSSNSARSCLLLAPPVYGTGERNRKLLWYTRLPRYVQFTVNKYAYTGCPADFCKGAILRANLSRERNKICSLRPPFLRKPSLKIYTEDLTKSRHDRKE